MNKKKMIVYSMLGIFFIVIIALYVQEVQQDKKFINSRNSYEKNIQEISINNEYISQLTVKTDFEMKTDYDSYDTQYDTVSISVELTDDFDLMSISDRVTAIREINEELLDKLDEEKNITGYGALLDDDVSYQGSKIQVDESIDIFYKTYSRFYQFAQFYGSYDYDSIYITGENGNAQLEYEIKWSDDRAVSVKTEKNYSDDSNDSNNSRYHTCEVCSKEGTHAIIGISGQTEYYCTEHYEEMLDILEMMIN